MTDQFVAEIRIFPFNFAPKGWAFCDGQLLPISQNTALFSLLGTNYGGDGKSNFALPNLQGSAPLHIGGSQPGPGLSTYALGETGGVETETLLTSEMPAHGHGGTQGTGITAQATDADRTVALGNWLAGPPSNLYAAGTNTNTAPSTTFAGGTQPHNNLQPYLTLNFCIAMQGVYPPRT
ncbi:MAG: phage tail protein [Aggregatilineales bacterium]